MSYSNPRDYYKCWVGLKSHFDRNWKPEGQQQRPGGKPAAANGSEYQAAAVAAGSNGAAVAAAAGSNGAAAVNYGGGAAC